MVSQSGVKTLQPGAINNLEDDELKALRTAVNEEWSNRHGANAKALEGKTVKIVRDTKSKKDDDGEVTQVDSKFVGLIGQVMIARRSRLFVKTELGTAYVLAANVELAEGASQRSSATPKSRHSTKAA